MPASSERDGRIEIGAATSHHDIATSALLRDKCPVVAEAAAEIGDPQVRNRGTIGGSLAHADPAADYPAVLLALDAEIHLKGPGRLARGEGAGLLPGSLHGGSAAPTRSSPACSSRRCRAAAYAKLHQRASHYAIVGVAAALEVKGGTIAVGARRPHRRDDARGAADQRRGGAGGQAGGRDDRGRGGRSAATDWRDLNADLHASAEYRRAMIPVFTRRALEAALASVVALGPVEPVSDAVNLRLHAGEEAVQHHLRRRRRSAADRGARSVPPVCTVP